MNSGYNPYSIGRWYRFFIESSGSAVNLVESDIQGSTIGDTTDGKITIYLPLGCRIFDVITDINSVADGTQSEYGGRCISTSGAQGVILPAANSFDFAYIYLFCAMESK